MQLCMERTGSLARAQLKLVRSSDGQDPPILLKNRIVRKQVEQLTEQLIETLIEMMATQSLRPN